MNPIGPQKKRSQNKPNFRKSKEYFSPVYQPVSAELFLQGFFGENLYFRKIFNIFPDYPRFEVVFSRNYQKI